MEKEEWKLLFFVLFISIFQKNTEKVWRNKIKCVPLQPQKEKDALVAQLVEHLTLNQRVQGSNPCRRTKET